MMRVPDVVVVEEREIGTRRDGRGQVARGGLQTILLMEHVLREWYLHDLHQLARAVGRSVVDQEDLDGLQRLPDHAADRLVQILLAVVDGHDHRHSRSGHRMNLPCWDLTPSERAAPWRGHCPPCRPSPENPLHEAGSAKNACD